MPLDDEGQVIALDGLIDSDVDDLPPPLIDDAENVFVFPNL